jgi:putative effector of murein hydrolase
MLVRRSGSSVSRLAAISLMAEFLAPLTGMIPFSCAPPVMAMRSIESPSSRGLGVAARSHVKGRFYPLQEGLQGLPT